MKQPSERGSKHRAYLSILLAAALWGIIGLWNRRLMAGGLSPTGIVTVRNCGGMALLTALFAAKDRSVFRVRREHLKYFFGTGVVSVVVFTVCYFSCQQLCSLAVASILLYTAPAFVVMLSAILWKEPITPRKVAALLLTLSGCAMVCGLFAGEVRVSLTGILLGLGAGFFYALYSVFGRFALAHYDSMTVTVWTFLFAAPPSLLLIRGSDVSAFIQTPSLLLTAAALVVCSTVLPYLFYTAGLSKVESGKAAILASLEPVVASVMGVAVFGEPMTIFTALGVALVLFGVVILR